MHSQYQTANDLYVFAFACVYPSKSVDRTFCRDRCNLPIPCFRIATLDTPRHLNSKNEITRFLYSPLERSSNNLNVYSHCNIAIVNSIIRN